MNELPQNMCTLCDQTALSDDISFPRLAKFLNIEECMTLLLKTQCKFPPASEVLPGAMLPLITAVRIKFKSD